MLDIKDDLERHEEAKELVMLLTTEAKDDPVIRSQVEHVSLTCIDLHCKMPPS